VAKRSKNIKKKISYKTWLGKVIIPWLQKATIQDLKAAAPIPGALEIINEAFKSPEGEVVARRMLAEAEISVKRQQILREVREMSPNEYKKTLFSSREFRDRLRSAGIEVIGFPEDKRANS
jgi:hypothetical protein